MFGRCGKAGSVSQATSVGRSISACLRGEYATMVRMVEGWRLRAPLLEPHGSPSCHSLTHAIQLTQNKHTPASKNFVTRTNFVTFSGIID